MDKQQKLEKAFDGATTNGKLVTLNEEQASQFIDNVVNQSKLLQAARVVKMAKPIKTIAKILDDGEFLGPGYGRSSQERDAYQFGSDTIELVSKEVTGNVMVYDDDIADNIEGAGITNHILGIITKKIANELEIASIMSIKKDNATTLMDMFDGFRHRIFLEGNVVDANSATLFPGAQRTIVKNKFTKTWKSVPTKYRTADMAFFSASDTIIDYNDQFDNSFNRNDMVDNILGRNHIDIPLMPIDLPVVTATASTLSVSTSLKGQKVLTVADSAGFANGQYVVVGLGTKYQQVLTVNTTGVESITFVENLTQDVIAGVTVKTSVLDGTDSIVGTGNNMIWGIQTENMSFETERVANKGYRYYYKSRMDFQVEQPKAAALLMNLKNN